MKNLFFATIFFFFYLTLNSQTKYNFFSLSGFTYYNITGKNMKSEDVLKGKNLGTKLISDGFNHYEIDLKVKTFTHNYVSLESGAADRKEVISKITNLVETNDFVKFDVVTDDFGKMTLVINKNPSYNTALVVVFELDNKTYAATFD